MLARPRAWAIARPRTVLALLSAPAALLGVRSFLGIPPELWEHFFERPTLAVAWLVLMFVAPPVAMVLVSRAALRRLLLPLPDDAETAAGADGFSFSAVAVTRETRTMVGVRRRVRSGGGAGGGGAGRHPLSSPLRRGDGRGRRGCGGAIVAFQRASRIAVGLDGVRVSGTSRTRFFAYRDLDGVELTRGGDVLLRRHGRVALHLQLHGAHEGKHAAIAERIRAGIARAAEPATGGAHRLAEAVSLGPLARAARGQGDYRAPGVTRDELWELVEAPATEGSMRAAAGEALALEGDRADRTRLRIAAERCAEPSTRAALSRVAGVLDVEDEEDDEPAPPIGRVLHMEAGAPTRPPADPSR